MQAIAQTFRVPLDELVGAPESGDPRLRNGRVTGLEPIWHVALSGTNELVVVWLDNAPPCPRGVRPLHFGAPTKRTRPAGSADLFLGLSDGAHVQERYRQRQGRRLRRSRVPGKGLRMVPPRYP